VSWSQKDNTGLDCGIRNMSYRFDLAALSEANFQRHRGVRAASLVCAAAILGALWWMGYSVYTTPGSSQGGYAETFLAVDVLFSATTFMLALRVYRSLMRPPIGLVVDANGLTFELPNGSMRIMAWNSRFDQMMLYVGDATSGGPDTSRCLIEVRQRTLDWELPWRKTVPITYLPVEAAKRILESVEKTGLEVVKRENARVLSLNRGTHGTSYTIWG